jgi:hypothetical protein
VEEPSARSDEIGKALQEESKTESLGTGVWGIGLWNDGGGGGGKGGDCPNYFFVTIFLMVIFQWNCRSQNAVFIGGARVGKGDGWWAEC